MPPHLSYLASFSIISKTCVLPCLLNSLTYKVAGRGWRFISSNRRTLSIDLNLLCCGVLQDHCLLSSNRKGHSMWRS